MKLLGLSIMFALCTLNQALAFSSLATMSLTLVTLNKPVLGFFGMFRRRNSPPIQETSAIPEPQAQFSMPPQSMPGGLFNRRQSMPGGLFNRFGGFGGSGYFFPGFNTPLFGMFGQNRFPPQFRPPQQPPQIFQHRQPQFQPAQPQFQPVQPQFPSQQGMQQLPSQSISADEEFDMNSIRDPRGEDVPGMNTEEAESFFTLLAETDESKCISRLVCEMGANPESGGEFGQTIAEIIGSLSDFPDGSKVSEYNEVLNYGISEGLSGCMSKFSVCDEESYQLVKKAQVDDDQN